MHDQDDIDRNEDDWDHEDRVSPTLIGFGVLAIVALVFVIQNGEKVGVRLIFPKVTLPLWVTIVLAMALGVVLDRLFLAWWHRRGRR